MKNPLARFAEDRWHWPDLGPGSQSHGPCGNIARVSVHIARSASANAVEKSPEKERGKECMNTKEAISRSRARSFFFLLFQTAQHAGMYHACVARLKYYRRLCHT